MFHIVFIVYAAINTIKIIEMTIPTMCVMIPLVQISFIQKPP